MTGFRLCRAARRTILAVAPVLAACGAEPGAQASAPGPAVAVVPEAWTTERFPADDVDSLAFWPGQGGASWVIATSKRGNRLLVFDASSGRRIREAGGPGRGRGQFSRPNGVAVAGDMVLVVERDNARVQVLSLPGLESLATFGEGELRRPYGLAVAPAGPGAWDLWVTDNFEIGPGSPRLQERIRQYRLAVSPAGVAANLLRTFGDRTGEGALTKAETIAVDPLRDVLLIAEEDPSQRVVKLYTREGSFAGRLVGRGLFRAEPEGIALYPCGEGGLWIATDQQEIRSTFHVLDRETLEPLGSFQGRITANTDGVAVTSNPFRGFPRGAVFAVHDDGAAVAFDAAVILQTLSEQARARARCAPAAIGVTP